MDESLVELVDKYLDKIDIIFAEFTHADEDRPDYAEIHVKIPKDMLFEYQEIRTESRELPNANWFWENTGICEKLYRSVNLNPNRYTAKNAKDMLDYLIISVVECSYVESKDDSYVEFEVYDLELKPGLHDKSEQVTFDDF